MHRRLRLKDNKLLIALTGALVLIVAGATGASGWTDRLNTVTSIGLMAVVTGLLISRSLLPTLVAHLFSLIIGLAWSFWRVGQLLPDQFTWAMRWNNMVGRINIWLTRAVEGGVSYDNLMFILQMGLIVWLSGYLTVWFLFRGGKVWSSILPGGAVLLIVFHYAPHNLTSWVLAFLLLSLLLIMRYNLMEHEQRWRANHVYFRSDIGFDFFRDGIIFSALIITLAWFAPVIDRTDTLRLFGKLDREWRTVQNEWNRMFASLNYKPDPLHYADSFSQSLTLGGPRQLTAKPVMMVNAPGGRYWRASVYDEYTGFGWRSSDQESVDIARNKQMSALPLFRARHPFTQTYTLFNEGALVLYAMANPVKFDRSGLGKVSVIAPADAKNSPYNYWAGKNRPWLEEITYIESDSRLKANEPYQVVSLVSQATQEQLRRDSGDYPNWITERYLQLPEGIPRRVFDLAEEITAQADTPYDKALAVETYLRKNITYNEGIAPPPRSRDKVDYILFDLKQAYCDYYATSMIVMLRSLGIPARLAAGFARGRPETLDNQERVYFVQNKDAHSWVEVFFPTYGWIEFEPTAAQPAIARYVERTDDFVGGPDPDRNLQEDAFDPLDRVEDIDAGQGEGADSFFTINLPFWGQIQAGKGAVRTIAIGGALLAVAVGGWSLYSRRKESQPDELPQVGSVYMAMLKLAAWMGFKKRAAQTPYEHAGQLGRSVPEIKPEVDLITTEFVRQNFSRAHSTTDVMRAKILAAWSAARPILYRAIFERRNPLRKIRLPFKW